MSLWVAVFVGGGSGAVCRWAISRSWLSSAGALSFPWPTFTINLLGSFLLGLLAVQLRQRPVWYALLGTGFCGGFTTFSTFSLETWTLLEQQRPMAAGLYVLGTVFAALGGAWLGLQLSRS